MLKLGGDFKSDVTMFNEQVRINKPYQKQLRDKMLFYYQPVQSQSQTLESIVKLQKVNDFDNFDVEPSTNWDSIYTNINKYSEKKFKDRINFVRPIFQEKH